MDRTVYRHVGDTWPPVYATIRDDDGTPLDLTGATPVLRMRPVESATWSDTSASIEDAPNGIVAAVVPTTTAGVFLGFIQVTQSGKVYSAPDDGYLLIHVIEG